MSRAIRVEQIRDGAIRLDNTDLRGMIRLDQSGVKASGEKTLQIRAEREYHGEREDTCQNRREKRSEKIRSESEECSA